MVRIFNNKVWSDSELLLDCHLKVFKMSSKIPLWGCSLNVFAIVIVFLIVFFVGQVMFSHHSGQMSQRPKSQRSLIEGSKCICHLSLSLSLSLSFCWLGHVFSRPPSVLRGWGLVWKALNPTQWHKREWVTKVGLELLGHYFLRPSLILSLPNSHLFTGKELGRSGGVGAISRPHWNIIAGAVEYLPW